MARADSQGFAKGSSANGTGTDDTVLGTASAAAVGTGKDTAGAGAATSPAGALERPRGSRIRAGVWSFAHWFPLSRQHCAWCGT